MTDADRIGDEQAPAPPASNGPGPGGGRRPPGADAANRDGTGEPAAADRDGSGEPAAADRDGTGEPAATPRRRRRTRAIGVAVAVAGLVIVAGTALALTRYLPALDDARALKSDVTGVVKRLSDAGLDLDRATVDAVRSDLSVAGQRLDRLADLLTGDPLVGMARVFPPTRDMIRGADGVAAAADSLLRGAGTGLTLADRYAGIREAAAGGVGASTIAQLVEMMATSGPDADRILADLQAARASIATVPAAVPTFIDDARTEIETRLDEYIPLLEAYTDADGTLPAILGWDRPVRYLVLTQNPAELRPTGGYIGSFGLIGFDKGRITERSFHNVFELDLRDDYPFVRPPDELVNYLLGPTQSWQLADANWSPDFPTAARDALRLYTNESGDTRIDGVLALTTNTVDELLKVTGPVSVGGEWNVTIAAGETTLKILQNTREGTVTTRKAILGAFADQLFARLLSLPPRQWADLVARAETFRSERLLQAWFQADDAQRLVSQAGWDGAIRSPAGRDAVYAVEANVSPVSKLNLVTTRATDLNVELDEVGNARVAMALTWQNQIETDEGAALRAIKVGVGSKSDLGLLVRVILPEFARFEGVSGGSYLGATAPAFNRVEDGRRVFGNYLRVIPGTTTLTYRWASPYAAALEEDDAGAQVGGEYRILIQKQPGLRGGPLTISVRVPPGSVVTEASAGMQVDGDLARVTIPAFERDVEVGVRFAAAPAAAPHAPPAP